MSAQSLRNSSRPIRSRPGEIPGPTVTVWMKEDLLAGSVWDALERLVPEFFIFPQTQEISFRPAVFAAGLFYRESYIGRNRD